VLEEHNRVRTNPQSYIELLEQHQTYFKGDVLHKPGEIAVQTHEGLSAVENAILFLKQQEPVGPLELDENLCRAADDHVQDIGPKGLVSHDSSDGKNVSDRIERYCEWEVSCGENIDFGAKNAQNIIINLIVDDGYESRAHRRHLFNPNYKFVGISVGDHKEYELFTVIDYVGGVRSLGTPYYDYKNFKFEYPKNLEDGNKKPKSPFQLDDPDAPELTVAVKIVKSTKLYSGRLHKITKKFYTLQDGTIHIVEVEDV
jgi:uncharacterized protein YkwD